MGSILVAVVLLVWIVAARGELGAGFWLAALCGAVATSPWL